MFVSSRADATCQFIGIWSLMQRSVVICGSDASLLETRRMLLERSGIRVQTALGIDSLRNTECEVLILCYSLSKADQSKAIEQYRSHLPTTNILVFSDDWQDLFCPECRVLERYPGPMQFVEEVVNLLERAATSSAYHA